MNLRRVEKEDGRILCRERRQDSTKQPDRPHEQIRIVLGAALPKQVHVGRQRRTERSVLACAYGAFVTHEDLGEQRLQVRDVAYHGDMRHIRPPCAKADVLQGRELGGEKDVAPAPTLVQAHGRLVDVDVQGYPPSKNPRERKIVPLQRGNRLGGSEYTRTDSLQKPPETMPNKRVI